MKIIKPGKEQKSWAKEFTCTGKGNRGGGCGAVLLVEKTDLFITSSGCYDGSTDSFVTFECPLCHCFTDIDTNDYPPNSNELPHRQLNIRLDNEL